MWTGNRPTQYPAATFIPKTGTKRLQGLDGLRALAVVLVILYHSDLANRPQAGFLGVDLFFVLSGFLITSLLLREYETHGRIEFAHFYVRRARRLLPALFAVLGATALAGVLIAPDAVGQLRKDVPAALLYFSNWSQIVGGLTYFESVGRPPLLQHLWSLAIEEQFYLVWPALLLLAVSIGGRRLVGRVAVSLAAAGTAWMTWLAIRHDFPVGNDPTRVYFGTDTHSMGLFVGAALAAAALDRRAKHAATGLRGWLPEVTGVASLVAIVAAAGLLPENSEALYRGGFLAFALVASLLIWSVIQPGALPGRIAELRPLVWIGTRSYGLYLWHWPVFQMLRPGIDIPYRGAMAFAIQVTLTVLAAELCYRCIETPLRSAAADGAGLSAPEPHTTAAWWLPRLGGVLTLLALVALFLRPSTPAMEPVIAAPEATAESVEAAGAAAPRPLAANRAADAGQSAHAAADDIAARPADAPRVDGRQASAFGDSVMLGAGMKLHQVIGAVDVDAEVGRQAELLVQRVRDRIAARDLGDAVIIHLGTNGFVAERQVRMLLELLKDRTRVVLVNAHAPRRWVAPNNQLLARVARDYPNVCVVDWNAISDGHPDYFVADDIHLTPAGLRAYTGAIREAASFLPPSRFTRDSNRAALAASSPAAGGHAALLAGARMVAPAEALDSPLRAAVSTPPPDVALPDLDVSMPALDAADSLVPPADDATQAAAGRGVVTSPERTAREGRR